MGNLTVIALRHDSLREVEANPEEFVRKLVATIDAPRDSRGFMEFGVGCHGNVAVVMPYKHASNDAVYMLTGNTITEVTEDRLREKRWLWERFGRWLSRLPRMWKQLGQFDSTTFEPHSGP